MNEIIKKSLNFALVQSVLLNILCYLQKLFRYKNMTTNNGADKFFRKRFILIFNGKKFLSILTNFIFLIIIFKFITLIFIYLR